MQQKSSLGQALITVVLGIIGLMAFAASKFTPGSLVVILMGAGALGFLVSLIMLAVRLGQPGRIALGVLATVLVTVIGFYAVLAAALVLFQDTIASNSSAFFQPKSISAADAQALAKPPVEALDLTASDGTHLRGWLVKNPSDSPKSPLILYFDDSGSEASSKINYFRRLTGWSAVLVNYRGFGQSEGTPSQKHAFEDATFLYDTFAARGDIDSKRIVSMGYGLGSSVAVYLSQQRPTAGTVLFSPYDHVNLIDAQQPGIFTPVKGLLKPSFDSMTRARLIQSPMITLVGTVDTQVPPERSLEMAKAWVGPALFKTYDGEGHQLILHNLSSWKEVLVFLLNLQ